jgi:hypothetical protein
LISSLDRISRSHSSISFLDLISRSHLSISSLDLISRSQLSISSLNLISRSPPPSTSITSTLTPPPLPHALYTHTPFSAHTHLLHTTYPPFLPSIPTTPPPPHPPTLTHSTPPLYSTPPPSCQVKGKVIGTCAVVMLCRRTLHFPLAFSGLSFSSSVAIFSGFLFHTLVRLVSCTTLSEPFPTHRHAQIESV